MLALTDNAVEAVKQIVSSNDEAPESAGLRMVAEPAAGEARFELSVVALPYQCDRVWRGVRTTDRKLVLNADGTPWMFFDLENDPLEMRNLVGGASRAAEIAELRALLVEERGTGA